MPALLVAPLAVVVVVAGGGGGEDGVGVGGRGLVDNPWTVAKGVVDNKPNEDNKPRWVISNRRHNIIRL